MFITNQRRKGATLTEYALIALLLAVLCIPALTLLGPKVAENYECANSALAGNLDCSGVAGAPNEPTPEPTPQACANMTEMLAADDYQDITDNGRYAVFRSDDANVVPGDTNGTYDIFVIDLSNGTTIRASVATNGAQGNDRSMSARISNDGRYVAFQSRATNLVAGDTNGVDDIFVRDLLANTTTRVSISSSGTQANASASVPFINGDGRYVGWASSASNLVAGDTNGITDVFVRDTQTNTTARVSVAANGAQGNQSSNGAAISSDGRYIAIRSMASNLVAGDTNGIFDVFLRDTTNGSMTLVSAASDGTQSNGSSLDSDVSDDGRYVAFLSQGSNLVANDTNGTNDIFVRDVLTGTTTRVSVASDGSEAVGSSTLPRISADGRYVAYNSTAANLVPGDTNGSSDRFRTDVVAVLACEASQP